MTDTTQDKTHQVVGDVKSALRGVKGLGDTIRGSVNESIDTAFNDPEGEVKNKAIKQKGEADIDQADRRFGGTTNAGTTNTAVGGTTTGAGAHPGGVGNTRSTAPQSGIGGTTTGAGAHSGGVGNMSSNVPQSGLGGEPTTTRERF
ncbi:uncharacterized protein Z520_02980 [Fonsecaea multimorphosa CBS 102226]|uniref:CsbD-like domain-containing protein n=1 Tax=Fonsecaea multimorphosa CBS 102226 TaxID=1442371 RepID=A0A0D2K6I4_9EURO|nr:uncharacterized protein Z520_02980 [Fonsecaea multimorphosa CBS 102226]KIY01428.1 hypothetical protein Z520_02980 [Fonsecaea multimorphosa CBS 102226]OAL28446.1 hypothetical protein AYO22_02900 [Fonsecaea multimorphosa]